ncbi:DUF2913 family protein [uncultured Vibrio sp.]|uniref:DUF2913 family protein n=1 Tax=uncultured Vibrio sp. TaxID=114054 RepID=UPI002601E880|nr:DUF2913 family protein [uncultured Vibrio sp.]
MSRNLKHYQALDSLVTHALLALYCTISQQGGFWTAKRRNELLVKVIKPKVKQSQFSTCKPEIKTMLSIGRSPTGNLERKLWDVNRLNLEYQAKFSQADELYIMLTGLFEQHQFPSMLEDSEKDRERDTLYMKEKGIENGFDEDNNQIKPLAMTVRTERLKALIEAVQANGIYRVEVDHVDEHEVIHLLLHRKK